MRENIDSLRRYESSDDFFSLQGSVVMKLSPEAAVRVCEKAADMRLVVYRVEGGIWHDPGFEARVDCIWDGLFCPVDDIAVEENNREAANFIIFEMKVHDIFVLSVSEIIF